MFNRTLDELAYEVLELYRATYKVTDSLDIRQVKSWIQEYRAFLLKQKAMRPFEMIDQSYIQVLNLKDLEVIDSSLLEGSPNNTYILRTISNIPAPIENNRGKILITRISLPDLLKGNINLYSMDHALNSGHGRFNKKQLFAFLFDNKIHIKSHLAQNELEKVEHLQIAGAFQDPYQAGYLDNMRYPIAESMIRDIHELIKQEKLPYVTTPIEDPLPNDKDNVINVNRGEE